MKSLLGSSRRKQKLDSSKGKGKNENTREGGRCLMG